MSEMTPEMRRKLLEELQKKYLNQGMSLQDVLQEEFSKIPSNEPDVKPGSSDISHSSRACDRAQTVANNVEIPPVKLAKSRRKSIKSSGSEDERHSKKVRTSMVKDKELPTVKSHKRRSTSAISSGSEEEVLCRGDSVVFDPAQTDADNVTIPPVKLAKSRRRSIKSSGSEDEVLSNRKSAVKIDFVKSKESSASNSSKKGSSTVKSSGSDHELHPNKAAVKADFLSPKLPSHNDSTKKCFVPKKQLSSKSTGPKQTTGSVNTECEVSSECNTVLKPVKLSGKSTKQISDLVSKNSAHEKPTKNNLNDNKRVRRLSSSKILAAKSSGKREACVDPQTTNEELIHSLQKKSNKPLQVEDKIPISASKPLPKIQSPPAVSQAQGDEPTNQEAPHDLPLKKSTCVQSAICAKPKSRKGKQLDESSKLPKPLPASQKISVDLQNKKSMNGKLIGSMKKSTKKPMNVDKDFGLEGDGHQLNRDEAAMDDPRDQDLKPAEMTDPSKVSESMVCNPSDKTHQDLEHSIIVKIEERGDIKPSSMKRKQPGLEHPLNKKKVGKKSENKEVAVMPKTSYTDDSFSMVKNASSECRVVLPRLSKECLERHSPLKMDAVGWDKQLKEIAEDTRVVQLTDSSKIVKKDLFLKPAIPKFSDNFKNKAPTVASSNMKSKNVDKKKTSYKKIVPKPADTRVQNPTKFANSNFPDPFLDLYRPKKIVDPLDKLKMDSEELDYEPGTADDDDVVSLYADSTIFQNDEEAGVPEDGLVQKHTVDSDLDSVASYGSDDSRRLSDMDLDSDDDGNSDVCADAQDEQNCCSTEEIFIPTSPKEIGIPVEVYSDSNIDQHTIDSVESGELLDEKDSNSQEKLHSDFCRTTETVNCEKPDSLNLLGAETEISQSNNGKVKERAALVSPNRKRAKECVDKKDDRLHNGSTGMTKKNEQAELSTLTNACNSLVHGPVNKQTSNPNGASQLFSFVPVKTNASVVVKTADPSSLEHSGDFSSMQLKDRCVSNLPAPKTRRTVVPSTPPRTTDPVVNIQPSNKPSHWEMSFDKRMSNMDIPAVHFESPKRVALPPQAVRPATLRTPDHVPLNAGPSNTAELPLQEAPGFPGIKAPVSSNHVSGTKDSDKFINKLFESIQKDTAKPNRPFAAANTGAKSSSGIQPIQERINQYPMGLQDVGLRQQNLSRGGSHGSLQVVDNPQVCDALMLYCSRYLADGKCNNNCGKLHKFPELIWDENHKRALSVKLVDKMLYCFPFWRGNQFSSTVKALGNYCDKVTLQKIVDNFWKRCCESFPDTMAQIDFNCWKQLAQAFSLCALKPAVCARTILYKVLLPRKHTLERKYYHLIDNIVDVLFSDFILNGSDLWFSLSILITLKDYEIPANVMREILRDTLTEPRNLKEHSEICDYLLRCPKILLPRKEEEWQLLHLIHGFLFVLQYNKVNEPLAVKLAEHFNIPVTNNCCSEYIEEFRSASVVSASDRRFSLSRPCGVYPNLQPNNVHGTFDNGVVNSIFCPAPYGQSDTLQNQQNGSNSQEFVRAERPTASFLVSSSDNNLTASTEFVKQEKENETHPSNLALGRLKSPPPSRKRPFSPLIIVADGTRRCVKPSTEPPCEETGESMKPSTEPPCEESVKPSTPITEPQHQKSCVPRSKAKNMKKDTNPRVEKASKPNIVSLLEQNKCGLAARCIRDWIGYPQKIDIGTQLTTTTLLSFESKRRMKTLVSLLQATGVFITGKSGDKMKATMTPIGLNMLLNFLREKQYPEAKEVHEVLWKIMTPQNVLMEHVSPAYMELITAWVKVKNEKVKEALEIITSNRFYEPITSWPISAIDGDQKLRNEVCLVIFDHCKNLENYAKPVAELFKGMVKAQIQIDLAQFFDDILQVLVKAKEIVTVIDILLVSWENGMTPVQPVTMRLILSSFPLLQDNLQYTPAVLHILTQEPYNVALPKSIEGLPKINVCLLSVWNTYEVQCICLFLLNCHMSNLNRSPEDMPPVAIQIKECELPTPGPVEFSEVFHVDPSIIAMQGRVCQAVNTILSSNSRFENGTLELDREAVSRYIRKRRAGEEGTTTSGSSQRSRRSFSRHERPTYNDANHAIENVQHEEAPLYPQNRWESVNPPAATYSEPESYQNVQSQPNFPGDYQPYYGDQSMGYYPVHNNYYNQYPNTAFSESYSNNQHNPYTDGHSERRTYQQGRSSRHNRPTRPWRGYHQ